jgi:hypothetical protein
MNALSFLIAPHDPYEFVQRIWESSVALVTDRPSTYFDRLMPIDAVFDVLSRETLFYPAVQVFHSGSQLPAGEYTTVWPYGRESHRVIDCDRVLQLFDQGATLNVIGLERLHPQVQLLNMALERESGFPVHTTGFLTPGRTANIPAHYDEVDFFVLQTFGRKRWRLWHSDQPLPLVRGGDRTYRSGHLAVSDDRLIGEHVLRPGDTLFVPRGVIHQTFTEGEPSFHITVGINPHRWLDVLSAAANGALSHLGRDLRFRGSVPMPGSLAYESVKGTLPKIFDELAREVAIESRKRLRTALETVDRRMLAGRYSARQRQLLDLDCLHEVSQDSIIQRRPGLVAQVGREGDKFLLRFHGKTLFLPLGYAAGIEKLETGMACAVHQICDSNDSRHARLDVIRRLLAEGYLTLVANSGEVFTECRVTDGASLT